MKKIQKFDLKNSLIDVCGWVVSILIIFFFFVLLLLMHINEPSALKEAFIITATFSAGLTTLVSVLAVIYVFSSNYQFSLAEIQRQQDELTRLAQPVIFIKLAPTLPFANGKEVVSLLIFNSGAEVKDICLFTVKNETIDFDIYPKNCFLLQKSSKEDFEHNANAGLWLNLVFDKQIFDKKLKNGFRIEFDIFYLDARNQDQKQRFLLSFIADNTSWKYNFQKVVVSDKKG